MIKTINNAVAKRRAALEAGESDKGFTLIELMVVIIIIGILAAIAIPAFLNQRQAAWDGSVKADIGNIAIAASSFSVTHNGLYTGMDLPTLKATPYSFNKSADNADPVILVATDNKSYSVTEFNNNSGATGHTWKFDSATGLTTLVTP